MSNVGPQAVSLSDLMKLGPQALGAMAQGQQPSIAPSYMVLAALKAVMDMQKGQQAPRPQQTVKDQVVAGTQPQEAMMAGIGSVPAPVQGFAGGGQVGAADINAQIADYFKQQFGPWWENVREETRRGLASRRRTFDELNYSNEGRNYPANRSAGAEADYSNEGRNYPRPTEATTPSVAGDEPPPSLVRASASSASRSGIGTVGRNPMLKYKDEKIARRPLSEMEALNAPKNTFLDEELAKARTPNEARLAELHAAEENAGLGAFSKAILRGRGFGGAFGPAVAEMMEAKEAKAEKRREYEDRREALARELGLKKGSEEYQRFMDETRFKTDQQVQQLEVDVKNRDREDMIVTETNRRILEQQKMALQAEANRIAAEVRRDGMDDRKLERLLAVQRQAFEAAQKVVQNEMQNNPMLMSNPQRENILERAREIEYRRLFPTELDALLRNYMGAAGAPTAAPTPSGGLQVRGVYPGR